MPTRTLITAGSTREPIDPVRFIGNRSSGKMGAALVTAAIAAGHEVTLITGPTTAVFPDVRRIDVETAAQMHAAVLSEFPTHHLLIMAAAVADFRPVRTSRAKLSRAEGLTIECEPTQDTVAAAALGKRADQKVIAFSLESEGDVERARGKMIRKGVDLLVFNTFPTMQADTIAATLLFPGSADQPLAAMDKFSFARLLIEQAEIILPVLRGDAEKP